MPPHVLESVFHLDGPIGVQPAAHDSVIADCIIAIQPKPRDVYGERISRRSRFDVERTRLRIAAENACDAFLIRAARIHGRGMDRVAGHDRQHWLVLRGKSPIKNRGHKFMTLRRTRATLRNLGGRELLRFWMSWVAATH